MASGMSKHLCLLTGFVAVLTAALAGFNAFVDPYGYFDGPRIAGVNQLSLGFNHRLPLAKALAVARLKPSSVILGNSRAETSYDPQHPGFVDQPAYNLGIGGADLSQVRRYFLESLATGRLREVFLAIDPSMFDPAADTREATSGPVLLTDESGKLVAGRYRRRLAFILLSGTVSSDSWWSLSHQGKSVATYRPSGLKDDAYDIEQLIREGGHHSASMRAESGFLSAALRDANSDRFRVGYRSKLEQFHEIVTLAATNGIRLTVVVNPIHARHSYVYAAAGVWPFYEQWKRDLVAEVERSPRRDRASLWDFSGISECTAEAMPPLADAALSMHWYRESSHFTRALGKLVLDRTFDLPDDGSCPGLGFRLTSTDADAVLAQERNALDDWIKSHPQDVAEIDGLAKHFGRTAAHLR